jgi:hypothetical protein
LRSELHPKGVEIVTVSLELSGPEISRPFIEAAHPDHPSLVDIEHRMDALFGVVNIPNVVWIDERGLIVRPAEPGWPDERQSLPPSVMGSAQEWLARVGRARTAPPPPEHPRDMLALISSGQERQTYPAAIRDWADKGDASPYVLTPSEVVARSQPRSRDVSAAAAHFELADHLWRAGSRELAITHFRESHRLQPDNWTYKRQAWSLVGHERVGGEFGLFVQGPLQGEEDEWPFLSDFGSDVDVLSEGQYYPKTM